MRGLKIFAFLLFICAIACNRAERSQQMIFYHRGEGYKDSAIFYYDYLAITHYNDHPRTAKELYLMARHYVDTVQADHVVRSVTFLAKDVSGPRLNWDSEVEDQEREKAIVSFVFSYPSLKDTVGPGPLLILTKWNGRNHTAYYTHGITKYVADMKPGFDSVFASPEVLRKP
jgi:hypothetical protein